MAYLPPEIRDQIASYLLFKDLRSLRFVDRHWSLAASSKLFPEIVLSTSSSRPGEYTSHCALGPRHMANPKIGKSVEVQDLPEILDELRKFPFAARCSTIIFGLAPYKDVEWEPPSREAFDHEMEIESQPIFGRDGDAAEIESRFTRYPKLSNSYFDFMQDNQKTTAKPFLEVKKEWEKRLFQQRLRSHEIEESFRDLFRDMTQINEMKIIGYYINTFQGYRTSWTSNTAHRDDLISSSVWRQMNMIFPPLRDSKSTLTTLKILDIPGQKFLNIETNFLDCFKAIVIPTKHLYLGFLGGSILLDLGDDTSAETGPLYDLLSACQEKLETLFLTFENRAGAPPPPGVRGLNRVFGGNGFSNPLKFPKMKSLGVCAILTTEEIFKGFLNRYLSDQVFQLEIERIFLASDDEAWTRTFAGCLTAPKLKLVMCSQLHAGLFQNVDFGNIHSNCIMPWGWNTRVRLTPFWEEVTIPGPNFGFHVRM